MLLFLIPVAVATTVSSDCMTVCSAVRGHVGQAHGRAHARAHSFSFQMKSKQVRSTIDPQHYDKPVYMSACVRLRFLYMHVFSVDTFSVYHVLFHKFILAI